MDPSTRYSILRTIGEGSQGKIKLAIDHLTGAEVALKITPASGLSYPDIERQVLMHLPPHPNICSVIEHFIAPADNSAEGAVYTVLVLKAYGGGDLFEVMRSLIAIPLADGKRIVRNVLSGLAHCHQHDIAHRDIKPENILLDSRDILTTSAAICDFGLATSTHRVTRTTCGTEPYAAPEVLTGSQVYLSTCADVWSAGCVMYNVLTTYSPWTAAVRADPVYDRFVTCREEFWAWSREHSPDIITPEFEDLFNGMCDLNPATRFTAAQCLAHTFFCVPS